MVRSRNARSWLTSRRGASRRRTKRSSWSRAAKSRSLVGSSSSSTSWRDRSTAASDALAASPPDSVAVGWSSRRSGRPSSDHVSPMRASRSAPPRASHRSSATEYRSAAASGAVATAMVAASYSSAASATPVRRATAWRTVSSVRRSGSWASRPTVADGGVEIDPTFVGLEQPRQGPQERRLAGAVGGDQPQSVTRPDRERDGVEHRHRAEGDRDVAGDEGGTGGGGHEDSSDERTDGHGSEFSAHGPTVGVAFGPQAPISPDC